MSCRDDRNNCNREPIFSRTEIYIFVAVISFLVTLLLGVRLIDGSLFPKFNQLYLVYFAYCLATVIFLHASFFSVNEAFLIKDIKLRRRLPKLLEYAYTGVIAFGLLQIFFSTERASDYLSLLTGDEQAVWNRIQAGARAHVIDDCSKQHDFFFTEEYCAEMQRIAGASDVKFYVLSKTIYNQEFLTHPTKQQTILTPDGPITGYVVSPIVPMIQLMDARYQYMKLPARKAESNAFGWIMLLLLPIGIGLRLVKTSLELFGKLD